MAERVKERVIATDYEERKLGVRMQELRRQEMNLRDIVKELNRLGCTFRRFSSAEPRTKVYFF